MSIPPPPLKLPTQPPLSKVKRGFSMLTMTAISTNYFFVIRYV
jgi:hypothetical protein